MRLLHINMNYERSSIYNNMFKYFNKKLQVKGTLYYPKQKRQFFRNKSFYKENICYSYCLNSFDRYFYGFRNRKLYNDLRKNLDMKNYDMSIAYSLFSNGYLSYTLF